MTDPLSLAVIGGMALAALGLALAALLRGWNGWLALRRYEIEQGRTGGAVPGAAARIELADLRERVRRLEAIATGIDP